MSLRSLGVAALLLFLPPVPGLPSVGPAELAGQEGGVSGGDDRPVAPGIFFGGSLGFGVARIRQPGLERDLRPGAVWDLHFGWNPSPSLSVGGVFFTWATSVLLEPVHLHTLGVRLEHRPGGMDGPFVGGTSGVGMTEGEAGNRIGGAQTVHVGYRLGLGRWSALAVRAGVHGHLFGDGHTVFPVALLELRFRGATGGS